MMMMIPEGFRVASPAQLAVMTAMDQMRRETKAVSSSLEWMTGAEVAAAAGVKLTNVYTLLDRMCEDEAAERRDAEGAAAVYRLTMRGRRILESTVAALESWASFGFRARR